MKLNAKIEKVSQSVNRIKGEAVDNLIQTVNFMFGRGAPVEFDNVGFNKLDYSDPDFKIIASTPLGGDIEVKTAVSGVLKLSKYKNKQVPHYDSLYQGIKVLIDEVSNVGNKQNNQNKPSENKNPMKVVFLKDGPYGSLFKIEGLGRKKNAIIKKIEESANSRDNIEGWKEFYLDKRSGLDVYQIKPKYKDIIITELKNYGYDTSDIENRFKGVKGDLKKKINSLRYRDDILIIDLGFYHPKSISVIRDFDGRKEYNRDSKIWKIHSPDLDFIKKLYNSLLNDVENIDVFFDIIEEISKRIKEDKDIKKKDTGPVPLYVREAYDQTKGQWHMAFKFFKKGTEEGERFKDIIKFIFPVYGDEEGSERFVYNYEYYIRGDYNRYRQLSSIFKMYGFDPEQFNRIAASLVSRGLVDITRVEGDLEGFQKEKKFTDAMGNQRSVMTNDPDSFLAALEVYKKKIIKNGKEEDFELYPKQKDAVAFLYGRQHAILGDAVGTGKTIQTIVAADMRMKQGGGNTIVITLPSTQNQWVKEIKSVATHNPDDVSTEVGSNSTWSVISYQDFQTKGKRDDNVRYIQARVKIGDVKCLILDEVHSIKNTGSSRTENIQKISSFEDGGQKYEIPFVWGATATMVANRPSDVYNQLKVINHPLGNMSESAFKREFGGMVPGRYGYEDGSIEEQVRAASKLKEWMINFRVFSAKTKKDIREDMPENIVNSQTVKIDTVQLYKCISNSLAGYKNPDLAVSVMIASRDCLASAKSPHSVKKAISILEKDKKVIIFTAFRDAANKIMIGIQDYLNKNSGGRVVSILGGMHKKTRSDVIDDFKNPNSDARAMVIGISAGGTGLDFPNVVEDVIENDFDWTPAATEQMRGRAWRINSERDINTHSIVAEGTVDEEFRERLDRKMEIAEKITRLTQNQLKLFTLGAKNIDKDKMREIEDGLVDLVKEQVKLEDDKSFLSNMSNKVLENIDRERLDGFASTWYERAKYGRRI